MTKQEAMDKIALAEFKRKKELREKKLKELNPKK